MNFYQNPPIVDNTLKKCKCGIFVSHQEVILSRFWGGVVWIENCVNCAPIK